MLGKLLKYEMKSTSRFMWIIYGAVIAAGLIAGLSIRFIVMSEPVTQPDGSSIVDVEGFKAIAAVISISVYALLITAMAVLTTVMIVLRFWRNMLGGEGYLMHTLPVPSWMLVTSKTIIAILWSFMAFLTAVISGTVILVISGVLPEILRDVDIQAMITAFREDIGLRPFTFILMVVIAQIASILQFYFSMSIGNLANKNKVLIAVLSFLGINVAATIIRGVISFVGISAAAHAGSDTGILFGIMSWPTIILYLLMAVGFFFGTTMILEHKLNLE